MSDNMTEKYQQHYNKILSGTITEALMKNISFQANIQLANDVIAEQEKTIDELQKQLEDVKKDTEDRLQDAKQELEVYKNSKVNSDNARITTLENSVKAHLETIARMNGELVAANKLKSEFDNLKSQINNVDIFRKELVKERENHELTKQNYVNVIDQYENTIKSLNEQIELLKAPPKRKKITKKADVLETNEVIENNDIVENTEETVKDGGTF